jgi:hypothetical protein
MEVSMNKERRYIAISIKHSKGINGLVLWGTRTKDDEKRCFSGYSDFVRNTGKKCELYSLEEFRKAYGNGVCKTDEPVKLTKNLLTKYRNYDTVLVDETEYMRFFDIEIN